MGRKLVVSRIVVASPDSTADAIATSSNTVGCTGTSFVVTAACTFAANTHRIDQAPVPTMMATQLQLRPPPYLGYAQLPQQSTAAV